MLNEIAERKFRGWDGVMRPLVTRGRGAPAFHPQRLAGRAASAQEVESHVEHTYNFLKQIPWTREIRNIPEIARGHHEKMNGEGYPGKLVSKDIPLQTRLMTMADIFDALAAADRPYKDSVSVETALAILGQMAQKGRDRSAGVLPFCAGQSLRAAGRSSVSSTSDATASRSRGRRLAPGHAGALKTSEGRGAAMVSLSRSRSSTACEPSSKNIIANLRPHSISCAE